MNYSKIYNQLIKFRKQRFFTRKSSSACINTGIYSAFFCFCQKLNQKIYLKKRFSAAYGNTALLSPVRVAAPCFINQLFSCIFFAAGHIPCVRVMAEHAAEGAALEEHHIAHSRTVHCPEGLKRMDSPGHTHLA